MHPAALDQALLNFLAAPMYLRYIHLMPRTPKLTHRLQEAIHLQALEGSPLNAKQIAMFEMFEREGWSEQRRISYILERAKKAKNACRDR